MSSKIVIVDDDKDILELLEYHLRKEGMETFSFLNPTEAIKHIQTNKPDAILTDWMMPDIDGLDFAKKIKFNPETSNIPLMMLTCKDDEGDVVTALELGFDDYMSKPFRLKEFVTRVKRMIKRKKEIIQATETLPDEMEQASLIIRGDIKIDPNAYVAYVADEKMNLTVTEFKLLEILANKPGRVFSRGEIIERINGMDYYATERSVDVQLVNLRKKMGHCKDYIVTIRSIGYSFKKM